ncbi:Uncharacterised protein [Amycolatopsis camponoti]|uniref:Uncharacterized protein n=1 Tax=Amycolatopsis camponoti TaxID=2606593 RepID=A0A6I8M8X8_9PSEU|nr:Uncharacterised protein [Amycolatopsis camponoti]VVJ25424.1 Uncharacterised protein [Amycolatopsis camponoti]
MFNFHYWHHLFYNIIFNVSALSSFLNKVLKIRYEPKFYGDDLRLILLCYFHKDYKIFLKLT